jgi:hypothetical protein
MGIMTAEVIVGGEHTYHDGIHPFVRVELWENSRPAWLIKTGSDEISVRMIPTLEHMVEDLMLFIGLHVLEDEDLVALAKEYRRAGDLEDLSLYDSFSEEARKALYRRCRRLRYPMTLVFLVFDTSSLSYIKEILAGYDVRVRVFREDRQAHEAFVLEERVSR